MDNLLATVTMLFFMFFILSAATETILEGARGVLEGRNRTFFKRKNTLEEAIAQAAIYLPEDSALQGKLNAIEHLATGILTSADSRLAHLREIRQAIDGAGIRLGTDAVQLLDG